jgi:hypothetical protein
MAIGALVFGDVVVAAGEIPPRCHRHYLHCHHQDQQPLSQFGCFSLHVEASDVMEMKKKNMQSLLDAVNLLALARQPPHRLHHLLP